MSLKNKKLVIFDCDGVLVDSEIIAHRVGVEMFESAGYRISIEDSLKKFTGISIKSTKEIVLQESGIELSENFFNSMSEAILGSFEKELKPLISEVLEQPLWSILSKCVASSSPRERVLKSLEITKQIHLFPNDQIFTSSQVSRGKPFPDLFLFAAKKMNVVPKDCLVIEDSVAGIQAACNAGMNVVGFLGGSHACFDWYQNKVNELNIPLAFTVDGLTSYIEYFYQNGKL